MRVVVGRLAVAILATGEYFVARGDHASIGHSYGAHFFAAICVHAQVNFSIDPSLVASGRSARGGSQYSWRLPNWGWAGFLGDRSSIPPTVFNIMDYNGYGDGRTDDSSAIQSAINAAQQAGGGTVIIPAGTFLLNNKIAITSSNVILKGAGPDKTKLYVPQSLGSLTTKCACFFFPCLSVIQNPSYSNHISVYSPFLTPAPFPNTNQYPQISTKRDNLASLGPTALSKSVASRSSPSPPIPTSVPSSRTLPAGSVSSK